MRELNKKEKSLLLFFETCMVDNSAKVKSAHMNKDDFEIAKRWNEEGFIKFGRIEARKIMSQQQFFKDTYYVELSDEAWDIAHKLRRERGKRSAERLRGA